MSEKIYMYLTLVQALLILLCGFSVLDFGVGLDQGGLTEEDVDGLYINNLLFDEEKGLASNPPLKDNDFYGVFHFWGYLMLIVGTIQIAKAQMLSKDL